MTAAAPLRPPGPQGRPAAPDDLFLVLGWRHGWGPLLAERWRQQGRKTILVLPQAPTPEQSRSVPPALRWVVLDREQLADRLPEPSALLAAAEPWRQKAGKNLNIPGSTALHLLDLQPEGAEDLMALLGGLQNRPGRLLFLSDPRVLGRIGGRPPLTETEPTDPETPQAASLVAAEVVARQARERGRVAVGLRLTPYVYGPGLEAPTPLGPDRLLPERLWRGDPLLWVSGLPAVQPLHLEDLGGALDALLWLPAPRSLYHLAGPEPCTWEELICTLHQASGTREPLQLELLTPAQLALRKPEATRRYAELAHVPLLDDAALRQDGWAANRRLSREAPPWLRWWLEQREPEG